MEANRPDPVDLTQFSRGQKKIDVVSAIGAPSASAPDGPLNCDVYKLYTRGPQPLGKAAIAAGEVVADVFTIGLAEVIFTPVEAGTKNVKHTVLFCFDADNKLASVKESETGVEN